MKYTLISLIPPIVLMLIIFALASCQPAQAKCLHIPDGKRCEDNIAVAVYPPRASTPDIVKVVAVALLVGAIMQGDAKDRPYNIVSLRPDHRALMVVFELPID